MKSTIEYEAAQEELYYITVIQDFVALMMRHGYKQVMQDVEDELNKVLNSTLCRESHDELSVL